jgi:hypothetical protein
MTIAGVNTDPRNPVGDPAASRLAGFTYARFPYNVSNGTGSLDFEAAHQFYARRIDAYRAAGVTPLIIFTHQTWGEGQGEGRDFIWRQMSAGDWDRYIAGLVNVIRRIAARFVGKGIVWQIGNENDNDDKDNVASVYMPPKYYGALFRLAYDAIKTADPSARVIIGGLVTGPGKGILYYNATGITQHDGIGIHTYGAGAGGLYGQHGTIEYQLGEWRKLGRPLWVTEFGVLNAPNEPAERVAAYAAAFMKACAGKAVAACWYGWGEGMHNGYGIENRGVVRQSLFEALMKPPAPTVYTGLKPGKYMLINGSVNIRESSDADSRPVITVPLGAVIEVTGAEVTNEDDYGWQAVKYGDHAGQMALHGTKVTWSLVPVPTTQPPIVDTAFRAEMRELFESIKAQAEAGLAKLDAYEAEALS